MPILVLTKMWLTNTVTTEMLSAQTAPDRPQSYKVPGEVRTYAGGRQRGIQRAGLSRTWQFELQELTAANVTTLVAWMNLGVTILARDHRGQSMYGTFYEIAVKERPGGSPATSYYAAGITVQSVDVVEGV